MKESDFRPEYHSISCELRALAMMVHNGIRNGESINGGIEYSGRRDKKLKRKKGDTKDDVKTPYNLGVIVESLKRRDTKKLESLRKFVSVAYYVERNENPRYMLRSISKENNKPHLLVYNYESMCLQVKRNSLLGWLRKFKF
ncbi:unnamed protein product [Dovyalis caffra]|uniref:Uncharacterized protein n=1 Tax=Dovyalis caffra TaxID=77055 RepID=A0AAV1RXC6_9ROSI|nr:unnamed protein product [Dovyalis caffra]